MSLFCSYDPNYIPMKRSIIFLSLTFLFCAALFSQSREYKLNYEMKALGANIGSLHLTMKKSNQDVYYHTKTLFHVNLLIKKVTMTVDNRVHYQNGQLLSAVNEVIVNGELHSSANIKWEDGKYRVEIDNEVQPDVTTPIRFSGSLLYWNEPSRVAKAFSESSGAFMNIKSMNDGKYEIKDPINNRNMIFFYEGGNNTKVQVKHPLVTISMIKQEEETALSKSELPNH